MPFIVPTAEELASELAMADESESCPEKWETGWGFTSFTDGDVEPADVHGA
jgi:hypothetical protein